MLYKLFKYFDEFAQLPGAGLFQYLSFRSAAAMIISLIISIFFGKKIIRSLKKLQVGETVRDLGLAGQKQKEGTPTMGGLIILLAILVPTLLLADLENTYVLLMILAVVWMAFIGFADDYIKVFKKNKAGLKGKFKILGQVILGLMVAVAMLYAQDVVVRMDLVEAQKQGLEIVELLDVSQGGVQKAYVKTVMTNVPFFSGNQLDYAQWFSFLGDNGGQIALTIFYILLIIFIVTAVSNGANLTDGIDGLAAGVSAIIVFALCIFAYVSGNTVFADYLNILYIPNSGELVVFGASLLGACIGFLWYNAFPAKVFMGDTGSLMLGGVIASMAIVLRKELLIPLLCGIFLIETMSVMIQVGYFKYTKKKKGVGVRVFKMAPIHHHFQKMGMHESMIVTRFWIVQILLAAMSIVTLKIR